MINERQRGEEAAPNDTHEEVLPGQRQLGEGEALSEQQDDPADPARRPQDDGQLR